MRRYIWAYDELMNPLRIAHLVQAHWFEPIWFKTRFDAYWLFASESVSRLLFFGGA